MTARSIIIAASLLPLPAIAQTVAPVPAPGSERRLSPEQIEAVLAEAANKRAATEDRIDPNSTARSPRPGVLGEVGFSIGTGGQRGAHGSALYPLGDDGVAAISLDFVDAGKRRRPR